MIQYIEPQNEQNLKQFKYKGCQAGYSYDYLWSPWAEFNLRFVPIWMAPNVITLIAFSVVIAQHAIFMSGDHQFGEALPPWKYIMFGVSIHVYQTLDNMDGKQARRTKNSSPVGMLFDHGADAITAALFGIQMAAVFRLQNADVAVFCIFWVIFYLNFVILWKQYATGEFNLSKLNPIDEGLPSYAIISIVSAFYDFSWFDTHHIYGKYSEELMLTLAVFAILLSFNFKADIFRLPNIRAKEDTLKKVATPLILFLSLVIWRFLIDQNIYRSHLVPIFYILTFYWGRNLMYIQLCYVANQRFRNLNVGNVFYVLMWMGSIVLYKLGFNQEQIHLYLICGAVFQCLVCLEFAVSFLNQSKRIMGIRIFHINSPPEEKPIKSD